MFTKQTLAIGILVLMLDPAFSQTKEIQKLELGDYFDMEYVSSPQISPSGDEIVYTRRWINKYEDKSQSDLWIMNMDGQKNRFLMKGQDPRWSPDGQRLAFIREGEP